MVTATRILSRVALDLKIPCRFVDRAGILLEFDFHGRKHLISNNSLGLITNADSHIAKDKDLQYQLLTKSNLVPPHKAYLDPQSEYIDFMKFSTVEEIKNDIQESFSFPLILKRNQGAKGSNVFIVNDKQELEEKLAIIFNKNSSEYDYLAIAQEYIEPTAEYRAIILDGALQFAYEKNTDSATFTGNVSPLHWENASSVLVTDEKTTKEFQKIIDRLIKIWPIAYAGLDIVHDQSDKYWLIEVNGAPSFGIFVKDNGDNELLKLYRKILISLQKKYSSEN